MLEYGFRSKCCKAPIRMGDKKIKKTNQRIKVWVCCACGLKDVDIISKDEALWGKKSALPWNEEEIDESAL